MRSLVFQQVLSELVAEAYEFHKGKLTEHLWPRDEAYFKKLADQEALYAVLDSDLDNKMVGVAYVDDGTEEDEKTPRWEFGGVYVDEPYRSLGVGSALGIISISNHLVWNATDDSARLIAHVHEDNPHPRRMLTERLGFLRGGQETPPDHIAPPTMKRNEQGKVVGHLFIFQHKRLAAFADWIAQWSESKHMVGKEDVRSHADILIPGFNEPLLERTTAILRDIADHRV